MALAILLSFTIIGAASVRQVPSVATAAGAAQLLLQPTLLVSEVDAGQQAGLFVHAPAFTRLTLSVTYPGGSSASYRGTADGKGHHVFWWTVPDDLGQSGIAMLDLSAQRGDQTGSWFGVLPVRKALPPPLFVQPLAQRFIAGSGVGIFVSTQPGAVFSYRLSVVGGTAIARGTATADASGRYVLEVPEPYLPQRAVAAQAVITVRGPGGSRTLTARFMLLPRPPLPLSVRLAPAAIRAGQPLTVQVSSLPDTAISLTISLASTVVARASGTTNGSGHWAITTSLNVSLARARAARLLVQARHGIDRASGREEFLLQPGVPGIPDRLASPTNPSPNLSRYFFQIPDKVIMVSAETSGQTLRAYEHGVLVHETYVTTGRPELPTPPGVYHVIAKYSPFEFISPWPPGSPFYYPPSWVHLAMLFREGGYFLHDAPWRAVYGPGTNLPHASDPGEPVGTHGCINIPYPDMVWLWNWTPIGTVVVVY